MAERVDAARKHLINSIEWKGAKLGIVEMRRHYTNYFRGFPNIKPFRTQLVTELELDGLFEVLKTIEHQYTGMEFQANQESEPQLVYGYDG